MQKYYYSIINKNLKTLIHFIGKTLADMGLAQEKDCGFSGRTKSFIPIEQAVNYVMESVRSEIFRLEDISGDMTVF